MKTTSFRWIALAILLSLFALPASASSPIPPSSEIPTPAASELDLSEPILLQYNLGGEQPLDPQGIQRLMRNTGAKVTVAPQTGAVRFIRFNADQAAKLSAQIGSSQEASGQAEAFFAQYGSLFGIRNAQAELFLVKTEQDRTGATHLAYQQVYQGVPVFAGLLRVHLDKLGRISAVNGVFVPGLDLNPAPSLSADRAERIALDEVDLAGLQVRSRELVVYRTGLAQDIAGLNYLVYEVEVVNDVGVREFVFVDAHNGKIVDRFSAATDAIHRRIYNVAYNPASVVWEEGDPAYTGGDPDVNNLINHTQSMYDLISHLTGGQYLSYDGKDAVMEGVANYIAINYCPNASWNGAYTKFCTGVTADDTVAHEWGHAYTEYTHGLIYQWQPGALNESYSDIFGEVVDLINGTGKDSPNTVRTVGACSIYTGPGGTEDSYRWLSSEDDDGFGGAIRDLWAPGCYGDPERMTDSAYHCSVVDGGGVHTNSGVGNHTFALLVDGGAYNGQTVTGIGLTKAIHIYWRAAAVYQTPSTDYADHADALEAACSDLTSAGTDLPDPATGDPSGEVITAGDCAQVAAAALATELRTPPTQCNFKPVLDPAAPPACSAGTGEAVDFFTDTFESDPADTWAVSTEGVFEEFVPIDWEWVELPPNERAGHAFFSVDSPTIGNCISGSDDQAGVRYLDSPEITIPETATYPRLRFSHYVATETGYDGGNVWIRVNGGEWKLIDPKDFVFNPYNRNLVAGNENTNPLAGLPGFTGTNGGEIGGSWGESQVYLKPYAWRGDKVQIRFAFGNDGCGGVHGWYVDDVSLYHCPADPLPAITVDTFAKAPQGATLPYTVTLNVPFVEGLLGTTVVTDVLPAGVEFAGGLSADLGTASYLSETHTIVWETIVDPFAPPPPEGRTASASRPEADDLQEASKAARMKADASDAPTQLVQPSGQLMAYSTSFETEAEVEGWGATSYGEPGASTWARFTDANFAHTGLQFIGVNFDSDHVQNEWLLSPNIYIPTSFQNPTLEFWAQTDTEFPGANVRLYVVVNSTPKLVWDLIADEDWPDFEYRPVSVDLSSYSGKTVYFAWNYYGMDGESFFLDDVRVYGDFEVPSQATLRFNVTLTAEQGEIINTALANIQGENVVGSARTEIALLDLAAAASSSKDTVVVGETFTYTFQVSNEGEALSGGAALTATLPSGAAFVSASAGCSEAGGLVACQMAAILPGETKTLTLAVKAPDAAGEITSTVEVVAKEFESDTADNQASVITQVVEAPVVEHTVHLPLVRKAAK